MILALTPPQAKAVQFCAAYSKKCGAWKGAAGTSCSATFDGAQARPSVTPPRPHALPPGHPLRSVGMAARRLCVCVCVCVCVTRPRV